MHRTILNYWGKCVDVADRWLLVFCVVLIVVVVVLNAVEIVTRYFFGYSSPVSMELAVSLSSWMYFLGYAVLLKRDEDVRMQFFFDRLGPKTRCLIETGTNVLIVVFFGVALIKAVEFYGMTSVMTHPAFPVKQSYFVLPVLLGAAVCLWVALYRLWAYLDAVARKRAEGGTRG
jgi:TRAP-type C4-dicarboxylate transport system permease small subunit